MGRKSREKKLRKEQIKELRLWHYTTIVHFQLISSTGILKPTGILVDKGERPALWLSSNPDWERTVSKVFPTQDGGFTDKLQRDDMFAAGVTPMRVEIDTSQVKVVDWKTFKRISGILYDTARNLERVGTEAGADPKEWYASFDAIPVSKWKTIEFWSGNEWLTYTLDDLSDRE